MQRCFHASSALVLPWGMIVCLDGADNKALVSCCNAFYAFNINCNLGQLMIEKLNI